MINISKSKPIIKNPLGSILGEHGSFRLRIRSFKSDIAFCKKGALVFCGTYIQTTHIQTHTYTHTHTHTHEQTLLSSSGWVEWYIRFGPLGLGSILRFSTDFITFV